MNRIPAGTLLAMTLLVLGCAKDPTASLRTGPKRVVLSASTLTVNVGDSLPVTATVLDDQGNPLTDEATATTTTPQVVSVIKASGAPLPRSRFYVKALMFGEGKVDVTVAGITESIKVLAFPASLRITGTPDSLGSGTSITLTAVPLSATNQPITGVGPITWESQEEGAYCGEDCASVTSPGLTSTVSGKTPGTVNIVAHLPGGATAQATFKVVPGAFTGTLSANNGNPGDVLTITAPGGALAFDATTDVTFGGAATLLAAPVTATTLQVVVPPGTAAGATELVITGMGADEVAQRTTFTRNRADDAYEATNDNPATAPFITTDGTYTVIVSGECANGVGGADCDDIFRITNTTGSPITIDLAAGWPTDADVDLFVCYDAVCSDGNFDGATSANPESLTDTIAPGDTVYVWLNLWDFADTPFSVVELTVSGIP
jgi:hypothetical protein